MIRVDKDTGALYLGKCQCGCHLLKLPHHVEGCVEVLLYVIRLMYYTLNLSVIYVSFTLHYISIYLIW